VSGEGLRDLPSDSIPVYTESDELLSFQNEHEIRRLISAGLATLVRDRKGITRRAVLVASVERPLVGESRQSAIASYTGAVKYTYVEHFEAAPACHALKRLNPKTGAFEKWPEA
jgi:hypothetical protein